MFFCSYNLSPDFTVADPLNYGQLTVYEYFDQILSTCVEPFWNSWLTAAGVRVADHTDDIALPAGQLVEGAVGAAGVAGGHHSPAVHCWHHLGLVWPWVLPGHQRLVSAAL